MLNTVSAKILELLSEGKNSQEIITLGFKKGTVYATQRKWRKKERTTPIVTTKTETSLLRTAIPDATFLEIESDPEIIRLKKEIRVAELQKQLSSIKLPPEIDMLIKAAEEIGAEKRGACDCYEDGVCNFLEWGSESEITKDMGEHVLAEKGKWHVKPPALYCALCTVPLELRLLKLEEGF